MCHEQRLSQYMYCGFHYNEVIGGFSKYHFLIRLYSTYSKELFCQNTKGLNPRRVQKYKDSHKTLFFRFCTKFRTGCPANVITGYNFFSWLKSFDSAEQQSLCRSLLTLRVCKLVC